MSVIHIRNLADAPQHVEEVSRWLWEQWARADGYSLEDIVYRTRHAMRRRGVPQMLVAEEDGAPVGLGDKKGRRGGGDIPGLGDLLEHLV